MAGEIAYDSGTFNKTAPSDDTANSTRDTHLLTAFLSGAALSLKDQVSSVVKAFAPELGSNVGQVAQLVATETKSLANSFKLMMASMSVAELEASAAYQNFKNRVNGITPVSDITPVDGISEAAAGLQRQQPKAQEAMPTMQEQLKRAGELLKTGDVEAGKTAFRQAIDMADKNYDATKTLQEIRQFQTMLETDSFEGRKLTQTERMQVHGELLNRFAASVLPYQLRSGSMAKDQAGYATVLRQSEQNASAESAYKDAIQKADAIPVAEMQKQVKLIADEMRRTNNNDHINLLSGFSQNLLGGKDAAGNEVPGAIRLPITARKDLIEFYIRPAMQTDGTALMSSPAKDGTPRFIPDANVVFKPEEANKLADQVTAKYKELYNIDLQKDPAKDAEFQVFKATIDINLPDAIAKKRSDRSYSFDSTVSNIAAMGVGLVGTAILSRFGAGKLAAKALPSLFEGGAAAGKLTGAGKVAEFVTSGAMASVTRNQMMTNYFDRKDETLTMSIANGFASTFGARALYQAPKLLGDKVFLRGFTTEVATARAAKMTGPDGVAQLAKLKELQPGLAVQKGVNTFEQWAAGVSASERATAISTMAKSLEPASLLSRTLKLPYNMLGQPFRAAENLTYSGIGFRRALAGGFAAGGVNTVMDAANHYSREWPRILNGEIHEKDGGKIQPTFENMVVRPLYKSYWDNSFVQGFGLGAIFAKPGALLYKPWGDSILSAGKRTSLGGKVFEAASTPVKGIWNTAAGAITGPTTRYVFSAGPAVSDIGGALANGVKIKGWDVANDYMFGESIAEYDLQLKRNREKLTDRKLQIGK